MLTWLDKNSMQFPPLQAALRDPNGLLAAGGDLSGERLLAAYKHGCFPWFNEGQPILWWSPDPRTVILPQNFHVSKSLRKTIRQQQYHVTLNQQFAEVIHACSEPRQDQPGTWITKEIQKAYISLHKHGLAHSVEVWCNEQLVGGLYGICLGQLFFGESMFSRKRDASKVGFATLMSHLLVHQFALIDCQVPTQHLASFGATAIERDEFAQYLSRYTEQTSTMDWSARSLEYLSTT